LEGDIQRNGRGEVKTRKKRWDSGEKLAGNHTGWSGKIDPKVRSV